MHIVVVEPLWIEGASYREMASLWEDQLLDPAQPFGKWTARRLLITSQVPISIESDCKCSVRLIDYKQRIETIEDSMARRSSEASSHP